MKFFKCEDGTLFSLDDIVYVGLNFVEHPDGKVRADLENPWSVRLDASKAPSGRFALSQADYERLVKVLEEVGGVWKKSAGR